VFASSLGPLRIVRCMVFLHGAVHSLSVRYIQQLRVVRFIIHHALLHALVLPIPASNATDPGKCHQSINRESSMMTNCCQSQIITCESIMIQ
jgi:hypothetical protein